MKKLKNTIIILFLILSNIVFAQDKDEVLELLITTEEKNNLSDYNFTLEADNEIEFVVSNMFIFYKKFVSSQDVGNCTFIPSCSVYALDAIRGQGLVIGMVNFFDRFSRCHGFSNHDYEIHPKHHLLIDPVKSVTYKTVEIK